MSPGRVALLSSSVALFGLAALLVVSPSLALWPALAALAAYLALILTGVMNPRLAMFARIVCRATSGRAEIALTFDDGPSPSTTPKVLAELARHNARATFFVLGAKAQKHAEVLRAIAAAGHEIGLHGQEHDRFLSLRNPRRIEADLRRARSIVEELTGSPPRLFRPPVGHVSPRTAHAAKCLDLALIGWNVRARDGLAGATAAGVYRRVVAGLAAGAIILLHDASERERHEPASIEVLPKILAEAASRGLTCVTVSEALSAGARG
jgi:peptidoglycan-N-acetylglucosamine deacetylase